MPLDRSPAEPIELLLPTLKCGGCIAGVERALCAVEGVRAARVNLSNKRVRVDPEAGGADIDQLIAALARAGHEARPLAAGLPRQVGRDPEGRDLLLRLGVAGFAAMNVMLLSISVWSGAEAATRDLLHWVSALIALPAMAFSGLPFFRSAASALAARRLNMDVPISLAILLSGISSLIETVGQGAHAYFDAGIMLIFFLLIGRYLDHRTRAVAGSAAAELSQLAARSAVEIRPDGTRHSVATETLRQGMRLAVAPGERVPADGLVLAGRSDLDRSLVTGESLPEPIAPGAAIHAGMMNLTGPLEMRVTAVGDGTLLADIARLVEAAERGRGRLDRLADIAARVYAPGVHVIAIAAFAGWLWASGDAGTALGIATAVLIITCPCALGLAVPTVHTMASARLFRSGIFLKDGAELERLAQIDTVAFDKTGTLTDGAPLLRSAPERDAPAWPLAAALARASTHPLAQAIAKAAEERGVAPAPVEDVSEHPGCGVLGRFDGAEIRLGRPDWVTDGEESGDGVFLSISGAAPARFTFSDTLRPDVPETVTALAAMDLKLCLLSGDAAASVADAAGRAGIAHWQARLHPGDKLALLDQMRDQGQKVLMVGDGLNDGPALAAAHASMSPAAAVDVAKAAAGLVFTGKQLGAVGLALRVARAARRRTLECFAIAAVYNAIAIPLAVSGQVTPLIAAAAMSGSSILVVLNALRLRNVA
ncbi:MAG: heavy metal translocating P-type ATPase [Pseudomonadota bacterium]